MVSTITSIPQQPNKPCSSPLSLPWFRSSPAEIRLSPLFPAYLGSFVGTALETRSRCAIFCISFENLSLRRLVVACHLPHLHELLAILSLFRVNIYPRRCLIFSQYYCYDGLRPSPFNVQHPSSYREGN